MVIIQFYIYFQPTYKYDKSADAIVGSCPLCLSPNHSFLVDASGLSHMCATPPIGIFFPPTMGLGRGFLFV